MASTIGIKLANGEFYSIVEENSTLKKRLVLTTVHDNQSSMQIDLYRSYARSMADALYIGSIVVENIKPKVRGEPSIELVISSNADGQVAAVATDLDTSARAEHLTLNVSLKSLDEDSREINIPDFELEQQESPPPGLYERASEVKRRDRRRLPLIVIGIGLALLLICFALWFFLLREKNGTPKTTATVQPVVVQPAPAQPAPEPPKQAESVPVPAPPPVAAAPAPAPVIEAPATPLPASGRAEPAKRQRPPAPVSSYKVPATIPRGGVPYKIRWGDTLWEISEAFYRNPWLYPRIARFNNIRNPDLIISGRTIRIPPKN
jgi:nucleoid-associated protein YgaU